MFDQAWQFIQTQFLTNDVFSGVALVSAAGGIIAYCRHFPSRIYNWCKRQLFMEFEITVRDSAFYWFDEWLSQQPYTQKRARWLSVRTISRGRREHSPPEIILSPAPGVHWMLWRGYFVIVHRERKEAPASKDGGFPIEREVFTVKMLTRQRNVIVDLLHEAREIVMPAGDERVQVFTPHYGDWNTAARRRPRSIETVILEDGKAEALVADVEEFLGKAQWYIDRGIPYRRGYLLHGPPGGGKSSIVFALASHLKLDIAILSLAESSMSDKDVRSLLAELPPNCILLIEDIDAAFHQREAGEDKENRVTFSGLLNALDGVMSPEGMILAMTTNHPEKLDRALIRPGRIDVPVFIGFATRSQAQRMFERFFPAHPILAEGFGNIVAQHGSMSMAALQGHFVKHCNDPYKALSDADMIEELTYEAPHEVPNPE